MRFVTPSFLLVFFLASAIYAKEAEILTNIADPAGGFVVSNPQSESALPAFIFEAVFSGAFGVVETQERLDGDTLRVRRYERVDDFAECESANWRPQTFSFRGEGQLLVAPRGYEHHLMAGSCVIGSVVDSVSAQYSFSKSPKLYHFFDRETGEQLVPRSVSNYPFSGPEIWGLFDLKRHNATLWDETGNYKRPDEVNDADVSRALGSSEHMRDAALFLLGERIETISPRLGVYMRQTRSTNADVADALIATELYLDANAQRRATWLRAAAAIPEARATLMPYVLESLATDVDYSSTGVLRGLLTRLRDQKSGRSGTSNVQEAIPAKRVSSIVGAAGRAAASFGSMESSRYIEALGHDTIEQHFLKRGRYQMEGLILAIARSPQSQDVTLELLETYENHPRRIAENVETLIATLPTGSLFEKMKTICFEPDQDGRLVLVPLLLCDTLFARMGDEAALARLSAKLNRRRSQEANEAAHALFYDAGHPGIVQLRLLANAEGDIAARHAVVQLCNLGPDAGPGIAARAELMADAAPWDAALQRAVKQL